MKFNEPIQDIIDDLLLKLGYDNVKTRHAFSNFLSDLPLKEDDIIERLKEDLNKRKNFDYTQILHVKNSPKAISKLADFTYCPISYSIRETYKLPVNDQLVYGTSSHEASCIRFITNLNLLDTTGNEDASADYYFPRNEYFDLNYLIKNHISDENLDFVFSSEPTYRDTKEAEVFTSPNKQLKGKPDFLYKHKTGIHFILEEKYIQALTFPSQPFGNHLIQCLAYLYALNQLNAEFAILVYWGKYASSYFNKLNKNLINYHNALNDFLYWGGGFSCGYAPSDVVSNLDHYEDFINTEKPFKTFLIEKSPSNENFLVNTFKKFKGFNDKKTLQIDNVPMEKCWNCVAFAFCNHKSGNKNELKIPYNY